MSEQYQTFSVDWQSELHKTALKFHVMIAWVAIILNPVWAIGDYFNIPVHFRDFLIFRIIVTLATLCGLLFRKKLRKRPEVIAFIPFLGISIQNAYMYSVMNISQLQTYTLAYITLFIGAGMFVLWKPVYSIVVVVISFVVNIIFFTFNSPLQLGEILTNGGLLTASVAIFTILLIHSRMKLTKREIVARLELVKSNQELAVKNKNIFDSINYAERIQNALLPSHEKIAQSLTDFFIFYKPKDIISGDFYWYAKVETTPKDGKQGEEVVVLAAVDCTGHGVPGAFMSIIGSTILNQTIANAAVNTPSEALSFLNRQINYTLNTIKDGMDISLCTINLKNLQLQFAGANNPIYIIRKKELIEIKADKKSIGADVEHSEVKIFVNNTFQLEKGDCIYLFTDGYADQFGGASGKKFKYKQFHDVLKENSCKPMKEQRKILETCHEAWKGALEQVDDILVIGLRV